MGSAQLGYKRSAILTFKPANSHFELQLFSEENRLYHLILWNSEFY